MYEHLRHILGPIQTVFLGMECVGAPLSWLYGALLPTKLQHSHDQSRRTKGCDAKAALDLLETVESNRVYNYGLGMEWGCDCQKILFNCKKCSRCCKAIRVTLE